MAFSVIFNQANGLATGDDIFSGYGQRAELSLDEVAQLNNEKLIGRASGFGLLHCFYQASDYGRDLKFMNGAKYFAFLNARNNDYPITVEFYRE